MPLGAAHEPDARQARLRHVARPLEQWKRGAEPRHIGQERASGRMGHSGSLSMDDDSTTAMSRHRRDSGSLAQRAGDFPNAQESR